MRPIFVQHPIPTISYIILILLSLKLQAADITLKTPQVYPPPSSGLSAHDLAIIVNDADPLSVQIAQYYQRQRHIPPAQMIHLNFHITSDAMSVRQFAALKKVADRQTPQHIQAYALTWIQPFRVECMSLTTAFAAGFDPAFCAKGCLQTRKSPYFASHSHRPFQDHQWRPTMVVAGENLDQAKQLIDRGVQADFSHPKGTGYLLKTSDSARSTRAMVFSETAKKYRGIWPIDYLEQEALENKTDVMFYFTGLEHVPKITSNRYLPGAVADHLTSAGGMLSGSEQMNSLEWLKAGATGTYGAVIEPCNFPGKFPNPDVLIDFYLQGNSLIEAYWKSVAMPGQGIFVGEPLAKPFAHPPTTGR